MGILWIWWNSKIYMVYNGDFVFYCSPKWTITSGYIGDEGLDELINYNTFDHECKNTSTYCISISMNYNSWIVKFNQCKIISQYLWHYLMLSLKMLLVGLCIKTINYYIQINCGIVILEKYSTSMHAINLKVFYIQNINLTCQRLLDFDYFFFKSVLFGFFLKVNSDLKYVLS